MKMNGKNISLTDLSDSSADMFLRNIQKSKRLTTQEEYEVWCQMRQGSEKARNQLINANLRWVVTIAKKYENSGTPLEDLLMAGSLGITKAADHFDASLGCRFITFATHYIKREVRNAAYDNIDYNKNKSSFNKHISADDDYVDWTPDRLLCYHDSLNSLKRDLDSRFYPGAGNLLDDFISMKAEGHSKKQFATKHHLSDKALKSFLTMVRRAADEAQLNN